MFIPGNLSLFSENSATASLGISFAIVNDFVLLYPSFAIAYLIAIIFLTCLLSVFSILYFSLNLLNASSAVAFSSILLFFFQLTKFSSDIVYSNGSIFIGKLSV